MNNPSALTVAIAAILAGTVLNNTFDEQTPNCLLASPLRAAALPTCPDKGQIPLHLERKDGAVTLRLATSLTFQPTFQPSAFQVPPQSYQDVQSVVRPSVRQITPNDNRGAG
jgi:hypothetical protein